MRSIVIFIGILLMSCKGEPTTPVRSDSTAVPTNKIDSVASPAKESEVRKIKLLVVQCSNGYEFAMHGYDFNPLLEEKLRHIDAVEVIPFPYKKLIGVTYQGVYDKKYCKPILDKVEADYFIMTRFIGPHPDSPDVDSVVWGYETKILNTKSMNQKVSIGKNGLKEYRDIEDDIRKSIDRLVTDIRNLK